MAEILKRIVIYTKTDCTDSENSLKVLDALRIKPPFKNERNISTEPQAMDEFKQLIKDGRPGTPRILYLEGHSQDRMTVVGALVEPNDETLAAMVRMIDF